MPNRYTFVLVVLFLPLLTFAQAKHKIDVEVLAKFNEESTVDVLIQFKEKAQLRANLSPMTKAEKGNYIYDRLTYTANHSQSGVKSYLQERNIAASSFYIVNVISTSLSYEQALEISTFAEVSKIMPDFNQTNEFPVDEIPTGDAVNKRSEFTYGLEFLSVPEFWQESGKRGTGVVVAGQDTGYDWEHPALKDSYRGFYDGEIDHNYSWHDAIYYSFDSTRLNFCGYNIMEPCDDHGHGTHTMGTMTGKDVSDRVFGIAPEAKWIGCRNMEGGIGKPSTYLECFEWFLAPTDLNQENPRPDLAPDIINNSWACIESEGCNISNYHILEEAVNNLTEAGILVVASAGNDGRSGCGSVMSPAAIYENSFSVGAINSDFKVAGFSSLGPVTVDSSFRIKPNIVAPGVGTYSATLNDSYTESSGTSMAGPHVAGAAALLISAYPELKGKPLELMKIIEQTAIPLDYDSLICDIQTIPNNVYGYGMVNLMRAKEHLDSLLSTDTYNGVLSEFKVYPSPAQSIIHFESPSAFEGAEVFIWNAIGILEYFTEFNGRMHSIDIGNLSPGTYFYRIKVLDQFQTGKFIKLTE